MKRAPHSIASPESDSTVERAFAHRNDAAESSSPHLLFMPVRRVRAQAGERYREAAVMAPARLRSGGHDVPQQLRRCIARYVGQMLESTEVMARPSEK